MADFDGVAMTAESLRRLSNINKVLRSQEKYLRTDIRGDIKKIATSVVVPDLKKEMKFRQMRYLPRGGGLNKWAASNRTNLQIRYSGNSIGARMITSRKNKSGKLADLNRMNAGRTRHPYWGKWPQPAAKYINQTLQNVKPKTFEVSEKSLNDAMDKFGIVLEHVERSIEQKWGKI
jgi:hypothetical protein